ncbi:hypothetical protein BDZ94DRAFT_56973 [Collybia nuda]|uniref:Transmembrane protein n=1 Tax=Collybia nuda TaxID=64659 RepID=A0A9P6CI40_9AGAR|nr:hypothetical protein BDZ94DRAFT_56973 [Collybia nuda]
MFRGRSPHPQNDGDDNDLYSYFNRSVSAVQAHADYFEEDYARPALRTSQAFFDERPIAAVRTFIATFSLLSFFPIVSFVGFSIFSVASFTIVALTCAFLASITVVLGFLSILVLFLLVTLCSSVFLTCSVVFVYTSIRFVILVRAHGGAGLSEWLVETKARIFNVLPDASPRLDNYDTLDYDTLGELELENKHADAIVSFSEQELEPEPEIKQENPYDDEETKVME